MIWRLRCCALIGHIEIIARISDMSTLPPDFTSASVQNPLSSRQYNCKSRFPVKRCTCPRAWIDYHQLTLSRLPVSAKVTRRRGWLPIASATSFTKQEIQKKSNLAFYSAALSPARERNQRAKWQARMSPLNPSNHPPSKPLPLQTPSLQNQTCH